MSWINILKIEGQDEPKEVGWNTAHGGEYNVVDVVGDLEVAIDAWTPDKSEVEHEINALRKDPLWPKFKKMDWAFKQIIKEMENVDALSEKVNSLFLQINAEADKLPEMKEILAGYKAAQHEADQQESEWEADWRMYAEDEKAWRKKHEI